MPTDGDLRKLMKSTDLDLGHTTSVRPKSLKPYNLLRRALLGLTILITSTVLLVILYDASISKASNDAQPRAEQTAEPTGL